MSKEDDDDIQDYVETAKDRMFAVTFHQVTRNQTLEEVAREFDKMKSLGDTAASFAAFVRNMKKLTSHGLSHPSSSTSSSSSIFFNILAAANNSPCSLAGRKLQCGQTGLNCNSISTRDAQLFS